MTDLAVSVGSLSFPNPVMTASGTAGHGIELAPYGDLARLGAFVAKSLSSFEWAGNPSPRVHPTPQGMINAVGLQGPGVAHWLRDALPEHIEAFAWVVTRHEIDYRGNVREGAVVSGVTEIREGPKAARFDRYFTFTDASGKTYYLDLSFRVDSTVEGNATSSPTEFRVYEGKLGHAILQGRFTTNPGGEVIPETSSAILAAIGSLFIFRRSRKN